jgi:hypothetical protein
MTPVVMPNGTMHPAWYRFLSYVANERLAGPLGDLPRAARETRAVLISAGIPGASGIYQIPT